MSTSCDKRKRETDDAKKNTIDSLDMRDVIGPVNGALYYTLLREADHEWSGAIMEHCGIVALEDKDKIERHLNRNVAKFQESSFDTVLDVHVAGFSESKPFQCELFEYTRAVVLDRLTQTRKLAEVMITVMNNATLKDTVMIDVTTGVRDVCNAFYNYVENNRVGEDDADCVRAVGQLRSVVDHAIKRDCDVDDDNYEYDTDLNHANMLWAISGIMRKMSHDFLDTESEMW